MKKLLLTSTLLLAAGTLSSFAATTTITDLSTDITGTYTAPTATGGTGTVIASSLTTHEKESDSNRYITSTTINVDLSSIDWKATSPTATEIIAYKTGTNSTTASPSVYLYSDGTVKFGWEGQVWGNANNTFFSLADSTYTFNNKTYAVLTFSSCGYVNSSGSNAYGSAVYDETGTILKDLGGLKGSTDFTSIDVNTTYVTALTTTAGRMTAAEVLANSMNLQYAWQWADGDAEWTDAGTHFTSPLDSGSATGTKYAFVSGESVEFTGTDASSANTVTITSAKTIDTLKVMQGSWTFDAGTAAVASDTIYVASGATFALADSTTGFSAKAVLGTGSVSLGANSALAVTNNLATGTLTLGESAEVTAGSVTVSGTLTLNNNSSLTSTGAVSVGTFTLADSATASLSASGTTVSGTATLGENSTLSVTGSFSAGTLSLEAGSKLTTSGVVGGVISGSGTIDLGSTGTFSGATMTKDVWTGTVILSDRTTTSGSVTLGNFGATGSTIQVSGISYRVVGEQYDGNLTPNLKLVDSTAGYALKLTNGYAGKTFQLSGKITGGGTLLWAYSLAQNFLFSGDLSNFAGTITSVDGSTSYTAGTLTLGGKDSAIKGVLSDSATSVTGTGTSVINWTNAVVLNYSGVSGDDSAAVSVGNSSIKGSSITFKGGANYSVSADLAGTAATSALTVSAGTTTVTGAVSSFGTISVAEDASLELSGTNTLSSVSFENAGTLTISGTTTVTSGTVSTGTLSVASTGTLTGSLTISESAALENSGTFDLSGATLTIAEGASLTNLGTITVTESTKIVVNEVLKAGLVVVAGDNGAGTAQISGDVTASTLGLRAGSVISTANGGITITSIATDTMTWAKTSGNWNTDAQANWTDSSGNTSQFFCQGDSAKFLGSNTGTITLTQDISAGTVTVETAGYTTTFQQAGNSLTINTLNVGDGTDGTDLLIGGLKQVVSGNTTSTYYTAATGTLNISNINVKQNSTLTIVNSIGQKNGATAGAGTTKTLGAVTLYEGSSLLVYDYNFGNASGHYQDFATKIDSVTVAGDASIGTADFFGAIVEIKNLFLAKDVTSATLTATTSHGANNFAVVSFGSTDSSPSTATGTAFKGTLKVEQLETNNNRHTAIQINNETILAGAVIDFASASAGKVSADKLTQLALAVNGNVKIAGLKDELTTTQLANCELNVFSGTIDTGANDIGTNMFAYADSANTLTLNVNKTTKTDDEGKSTTTDPNYSFSGNFIGVNISKTGDGTQTLSGVISDHSSTVKSAIEVSAGTLVLSGENTYTGGTTITGGTLEVANASALGSGDVTVDNDANLSVSVLEVTAGTVNLKTGATLVLTDDLFKAIEAEPSANANEYSALTIIIATAIQLNGTTLSDGDVTADLKNYVEYDTAFSAYAATWEYVASTGTLKLSLAIPEPSMFGLLAGTLALALAGTRRRRKSVKA